MAECEDDGTCVPGLTNAELVDIINENLALQAEAIASCCGKLADDVEKGIISSVSGVEKVCGKIEKKCKEQTKDCCVQVDTVMASLESSLVNVLTEQKIQNNITLERLTNVIAGIPSRAVAASSDVGRPAISTATQGNASLASANETSETQPQEAADDDLSQQTAEIIRLLWGEIAELKNRIDRQSPSIPTPVDLPNAIDFTSKSTVETNTMGQELLSLQETMASGEYFNVASLPNDPHRNNDYNSAEVVNVRPRFLGVNPVLSVVPSVDSSVATNVSESVSASAAAASNLSMAGSDNPLQPLLDCPPSGDPPIVPPVVPPGTVTQCCPAYDPFADFFAWRFGPMTAAQRLNSANMLRLPHSATATDIVQLIAITNAKEKIQQQQQG